VGVWNAHVSVEITFKLLVDERRARAAAVAATRALGAVVADEERAVVGKTGSLRGAMFARPRTWPMRWEFTFSETEDGTKVSLFGRDGFSISVRLGSERRYQRGLREVAECLQRSAMEIAESL
jgi:hypothetical protein